MTLRVFCVVEGHGDVAAYPILIRRIAGELYGEYDVEVERPFRLPKDKMLAAEEILPVLEFGEARLLERCREGDKKLLLITRDADDECPVTIASSIWAVASQLATADHCRVVVANEEFESWFLAGVRALDGHRDCRNPLPEYADADAIRSPKGAFERSILKPARSYSETVDQPKFAALISLEEEAQQRSRSLRRLASVIEMAILAD